MPSARWTTPSAITQMRAAKPDWVFATGYINDLVLIRKQMNDLGVARRSSP